VSKIALVRSSSTHLTLPPHLVHNDKKSDWHKAGKGPDPKLAALDKEMDEYRAAAKKTEA